MNELSLRILQMLRMPRLIKINCNGRRMFHGTALRFPIRGSLGWEYLADNEPWMTAFLYSLREYFSENPGGAFLDIGVNIGQTLAKYKSLIHKGCYIGFEPNPDCVAYVTALIDLNKWDDVDIYPIGIGETAGILDLNLFHTSSVDSTASIIAEFRPNQLVRKRIHFPIFPLSSVQLNRSISFMKIDVEGAELEVLRGSKPALQESRPLVSTEILPCYDASNTFRLERQRKVESLFRDIGYCCYRIKKTGMRNEHFAGLQPLCELEIHSELSMSDYLWIPSELSEHICAMISKSLA